MSAINSVVEGQTLPYPSSIHSKGPIIFGKVSRSSESGAFSSTVCSAPWVNSASPIIFGRVSFVSGRPASLKPTRKVTIGSIPEACIHTAFSFLLLKDRHAVNLVCKMWKGYLVNLSLQEKNKISEVLKSITDNLPVSFEKQERQIFHLMDVYKSVMHPLTTFFEKRDVIYKHALNILGFSSGRTFFQLEFNESDPLLKQLLKQLLENPDIGMFIIQKYKDTIILPHLPEDHPRYVEMALEAIKGNQRNIGCLKQTHPNYKMIIYEAIKNDAAVIESIRELVYPRIEINWEQACKSNGMCLQYVSEWHPNYEKLAVEALRNNPNVLHYIPEEMLSSHMEWVIEVVKTNPMIIEFLPENIRLKILPINPEVAIEAVNKKPSLIHYIFEPKMSEIPNYRNAFLRICEKNPNILNKYPYAQNFGVEVFQKFLESL